MNTGSRTRESVFHTTAVERPLCFWENGRLLFFETLNRELVLFDRATGCGKYLGAGEKRMIEAEYGPFHQHSKCDDIDGRCLLRRRETTPASCCMMMVMPEKARLREERVEGGGTTRIGERRGGVRERAAQFLLSFFFLFAVFLLLF